MKIIFILIIVLISNYIYANNNELTIRKDLNLAQLNDYTDKLDLQEKEIQHLLGRVEVLEHTVSRLEQNFESITKLMMDSQKLGVVDNSVQDVFDVISSPQIYDKNKSSNINNVEQNNTILKDKQLYDLALASLKDKKFSEAEEKFVEFLKNYPNSPLLSNGYFWYGEVFFRQNVYDKAAINYLKSYKTLPKGPKASDALLKLSLSLGKLNKYKEACSVLMKLEEEFPIRAAISIKRTKDAKLKFGCTFNK